MKNRIETFRGLFFIALNFPGAKSYRLSERQIITERMSTMRESDRIKNAINYVMKNKKPVSYVSYNVILTKEHFCRELDRMKATYLDVNGKLIVQNGHEITFLDPRTLKEGELIGRLR